MSCTINASTSAGLVMTSDLSGVLQFQNNGVAVPPLTVAPAFSAYQSTLQSLTLNTSTKIQFQTEEFDTNSNFDNATNYRFTPTVAGYYQISGNVQGTSIASVMLVAIYKNGSAYKYGCLSLSGVSNASLSTVSSLVYLNGSTDYVELYAFTGTTQNTQTGISATWFNGSLVRSA